MNIKNFKLTNYPEGVFIGTWILAFLIYQFVLGSASLEVLVYFSAFSFFFIAGSVFFSAFRYTLKLPYATSSSTLAFVVIILIIANIIYTLQVINFVLSSASVALALFEIRQSTLQGNSVINGMALFVGANQLLFGLSSFGYVMLQYDKAEFGIKAYRESLKKNNQKNSYLFIFGILISLAASLADGSRSFFLSALLALLFMLYQLAIIKVRQIIIFLTVFIFLFSATFSIFRTDAGDDLSDGFKYAAAYFSGGIGSLDYAMRGEVEVYWHDLEALENKLESMGLPFDQYDLQSLKMDYVDVGDGIQSNVYTALGVYHEYMGYASLLFAFFMGGFVRYMCFLSKSGILGLYCYSIYLTALILSVFHDYFLSFSYLLFKILLILFCIQTLEHFLRSFALAKNHEKAKTYL